MPAPERYRVPPVDDDYCRSSHDVLIDASRNLMGAVALLEMVGEDGRSIPAATKMAHDEATDALIRWDRHDHAHRPMGGPKQDFAQRLEPF